LAVRSRSEQDIRRKTRSDGELERSVLLIKAQESVPKFSSFFGIFQTKIKGVVGIDFFVSGDYQVLSLSG
jgi:hypothetical protein